MNAEIKLTLIYLILGIAAAVASTYLDTMLAFGMAIVVYGISFMLVRQFVKVKEKFSWFVVNTSITFLLVWLVVWILLLNIK